GHGANIIMGVGEDEDLGEAIAVTVIATGFNVDQQDDIVNTESKKIIHTLEEEQKAEQDLSDDGTVMYHLEEEESREAEPVIKHTLEIEEEMELIPTTNFIRNFNVFYEEVIAEEILEEDFIIIDSKDTLNDIEVVDPEELSSKPTEKEQISFSFDMPISNSEEKEEEQDNVVSFSLDEEVKDMDVNDHIEVIPVLEYNKEGETRYSLDDYMELENKLTGAKSKAEEYDPKLVEDELIFEKKTVSDEQLSSEDKTVEEVDPMHSPIEEMLKERADERRRKLKDFNYKFQNSVSSIDEIEKEPAYKRQGVDLEATPKEGKVSKTSLSEDSNGDIQLRSNNSFFHDNVD
ncbi:MAG: cell division protein FtsZ, partial [Eudoraea sp.]|nr:cell division protein FtsZ [Eudoraea sp.]